MPRLPVLILGCSLAVAGCKPDYSANTYSSNAVQQANKVDQGVIIGRRQVGVTPSGATGAVSGAAAGGIAGSQVGTGVTAAFSALGGSLAGGLVGTAVEKSSGKVTAYEYVVRKDDGGLLSVTQQDTAALPVGQKVLVIAGAQARIVPDYTVSVDPAPPLPGTDGAATPPPVTKRALLPPPDQADGPVP